MKGIRKNILQVACGNRNYDDAEFHVFDIGRDHIYSSLSGLEPDSRLMETHKDLIHSIKPIKVNVRTLDHILSETNLFDKKIDFISIDTENTELDVLKGFTTLPEWDVSLLVVENNFDDPFIEEYLEKYDYVKDQRYKINDFYVRRKIEKFVSDGEYESEDVDKYLRTFFPDYSYKGVFVDVGAFHSQLLSNSYHFELNNWNVICIEPNPNCYEELQANRKCVLPYAAYWCSSDNVNFCIDKFGKDTIWKGAGASALEAHYVPHVGLREVVKVNTRTLDCMLEEQKVDKKLDILSIDVEGSEIYVLRGLDLSRWRPRIIVIENIKKKGHQSKYLLRHGYEYLNRIVFNDFYILGDT
jgi:FkbM family methyltransferase